MDDPAADPDHAACPELADGHAVTAGHADTRTPAQYWEERYGSEQAWSGMVNATTAAVVASLPRDDGGSARALDLGCGEGADAIWLAQQGWATTGVDISTTATERARLAALEAGLTEDRIRFVAADLSAWATGPADEDPSGGLLDGPFDLVTASFFHSTVDLARTAILRRAAGTLAAGGHLLLVSHAAPPPWAVELHRHGREDLRDPAAERTALALDPALWDTELAEVRRRQATSPTGQPAELEDAVLLLRRR